MNRTKESKSNSACSLSVLPTGQRGCVDSVSSSNRKLCNKLLSMGIVAGTIIEVLGVAPLGDPINIKALGYKLSIRVSEADGIQVTPV